MGGDGRQRRRALLGGLLIAGLIAFGLVTFFLYDVIALFARRYEVIAVVPEAPGLVFGSPVWVAGKEVGTVEQVALLPVGNDTTAHVALTLQLPRSVRSHVRTDSRVRLTSARMVGAKVVDIVPGSANAQILAHGDTLRLDRHKTAAAVTQHAAIVESALDTALAALRIIMPVARTRLEQTRRAFAALEPALREAGALRASLESGAGIATLRDPAFAASLQRARSAAAALPAAFAQMQVRAGEMKEVGAALARLQLRTDSLRAQLTAAADLLGQSNGSLTRFQQDSALIRAIIKARADLDSLIAEARRNPLRFVF